MTDLSAARVRGFDRDALLAELDETGTARTPRILEPERCAELSAMFDDGDRFRSTVDMARHRFGRGTYRYFAHPLPDVVTELREACYDLVLHDAE